jgi:Glycosyl transferase family 2
MHIVRVVIGQFFNEAYLLPWWLKHHREIFDHGVLINDNSTDASVEICRELVPHWEVVPAEFTPFETVTRDFEVMKHESRFPQAWKMALNITEFLVAPSLSQLEATIIRKHDIAARLRGAIMVDTEPESPPDPNEPLLQQKTSGFWEAGFDFHSVRMPGINFVARRRIYHRYTIGAYLPGRHSSHLPGQYKTSAAEGAILWYGFSPWSSEFKARKLQIGATIGDYDRRYGLSIQHYSLSLPDLERQWSELRKFSGPLFSRAEETGRSQTTAEPERAMSRLARAPKALRAIMENIASLAGARGRRR